MRPNCQKACNSCGELVGTVYAPTPRPGDYFLGIGIVEISGTKDVIMAINCAITGLTLASAPQMQTICYQIAV
ncbi:hypothetical protein B9Z55_025938 [Caenorhabditis nigoni]|nr:hypothetical protein B9Z55_025938 [Caenorhabditis nigoni]